MILAYTVTSPDMWEAIAVNSFLEALGDPYLALEIRKKEPQHLRKRTYRDATPGMFSLSFGNEV